MKRVLSALNQSVFIPLAFCSVICFIMFRLFSWPILVLIVPFCIAFLYWFVLLRNKPVMFTRSLMVIYLAMYSVQLLHLNEEWVTGFYKTFPALWGHLFFANPGKFEIWNTTTFITGNLLMDFFWAVALILLEYKNAWSNYVLHLFLSGMVINAIQHPFYAVWLATHPDLQQYFHNIFGLDYGWYFPGLFTSVGHMICAFLMILELRRQYAKRS
jgi:hypothetical protein